MSFLFFSNDSEHHESQNKTFLLLLVIHFISRFILGKKPSEFKIKHQILSIIFLKKNHGCINLYRL
jgi:hypothetical protein